MRRAHALVVTGAPEDLPEGCARIRQEQGQMDLGIPLFPCERRLEGFLRVETDEPVPPAALKGMKVLAFSGIARPLAFESDLRSLGLDLTRTIRFRDHQPLGPAQLERIGAAARESRADLVVTTEKDRARLGAARFRVPLYTLRIRLVPRSEDEFWDFVSGRLFSTPVPTAGPGS